jgi:hypothetical protein
MNGKVGWVSLAAITCAAVTVSAQQKDPQAVPVAHITVVGCLQPSDQAGSTEASTKYSLTNVKPAKDASAASGTSGTTGTSRTATTSGTSGSQTAKTYRLDANDSTLNPEVGHEVEIIAVVEDPDTAHAGKSAAAKADTTPTLKVEHIRLVAVPCTQ